MPKSMSLPKLTKFQLAVHFLALLPLALLVWDAVNDNLTFNPIQAATLRTGKTALVLLVLSLAATPINTVTGFRQALKVRRALGLYAFLYAAIHFYIYSGIDYGFDLNLIWLELAEKRFVLVGFAAFLVLLPLALTSTKGWQRRLGRTWKRLHRWVYLAGILVIFHYIWVVKSDIREPLIWGAILGLLLILRIPAVRKKVVHWRTRLTTRLRDLRGAAASGA
jgi:sulfoxide reductase heme-binding subunit YedZ